MWRACLGHLFSTVGHVFWTVKVSDRRIVLLIQGYSRDRLQQAAGGVVLRSARTYASLKKLLGAIPPAQALQKTAAL
jgi:hypothetical protein